MSLNVGTLHMNLVMNDQGVVTGLNTARTSAEQLEQTAKRTSQSTREIGTAGKESGRQLGDGFKAPVQQADGLTAAIGKAKAAAALLGIALGAKAAMGFFTSAIDNARAVSAQINQMNVIFKDSAGDMQAWGDQASTALFSSKREAQGAAITFATFGTAAGMAGKQLATFSQDMTKLAVETASFQGTDLESVISAMGSAFAGMSRPMREYGVLLDQSTLQETMFAAGLTESRRELTAQEKVIATQIAMKQQLAHVEGDIERSAGKYGQNLKGLKARYEETSAAIGQKLIPMANAFVQLLSGPGLSALSSAGDVIGGLATGVMALGQAFGSLPGPVQTMIIGLVAAKVAALALGTAAGGALVAKLVAARVAMVSMGQTAALSAMIMRSTLATSFTTAAGAATRFGAVGRATAGTMGVMKTAGSGLASMMGGPLGIAIAAAALAYGLYAAEAAKAKAVQESITAGAADVGEALAISGGKHSEMAEKAAVATLETVKLRDGTTTLGKALSNLGVDGKTAAEGLAGVGEAAAETRAELEKQSGTEFSFTDMLRGQSFMDSFRAAMGKGNAQGEVDNEAAEALKVFDATAAAIKEKQAELKRLGAAGGDVVEAVGGGNLNVGPITQAFKEIEESAGGAASAVEKLASALSQMNDDELTEDSAMQSWNDAIRDFAAASKELGDGVNLSHVIDDVTGAIDTTTKAGSALRDSTLTTRDALNEVATASSMAGDDAATTAGKMQPLIDKFVAVANEAGVFGTELEQMMAMYGLDPNKIVFELDAPNRNEVAALVELLDWQITSAMGDKTITLHAQTAEAEAAFKAAGITLKEIEGSTEVELVAETAAGQALLDQALTTLGRVPSEKHVRVDTPGGQEAIAELEALNVTTQSDNEKRIIIDHPTPEVIALMGTLNMGIQKLPDGRFVITSNIADQLNEKEKLKAPTSSTHTVRVMQDTSLGNLWPGAANGMVRQRAQGALDTAQIQSGSGAGRFQQTSLGPVQWAEQETGWEAFIPGAPSKRRRSLQILRETAHRMGQMIVPRDAIAMADGGVRDGELDSFAQGFEGQKYGWGQTGYVTDCSGAVSALANKAVGQDPFGSRAGTASMGTFLAQRGFQPGSGGAGALSVGWYNGGPYGGHTAATLPSGVNVEMGGARGDGQYGGPAAGANDPMFTDRMHLPAEMVQGGGTGGDASMGLQGALAKAEADRDAATTDEGRAKAQTKVDMLQAKIDANPAQSDSGTGQAVRVTNWPSGFGGSSGPSISMSGGGGGSYGGGDPNVMQELAEDNPPAVDHEEVARLTMQSGFEKAAEAARDSLLGDLGLSGNGFISQLFKQVPEIDKLFREQADEDRENGVAIQNVFHLTVRDDQAAMREIEGNTRRALYQFGGGQ